MVLTNSTPNSKQPGEMFVNTDAMNSADLRELVKLNAEIEERRRSHPIADRSNACGLLQATMTREELFEVSSLDDDRFLTALEHQNSYVTPSKVQVTDLDLSSIENLMKYFDEDVPVTPTKPMDAAHRFSCTGKVASAIAKLASTQVEASATPPKVITGSGGKLKISALKQKYEQPQTVGSPQTSSKGATHKLPSKVKEIAQRFNTKINKVMRRTEEPQYMALQNELSPDPKPVAKPRTESGTCLVAEEVFRELSVRDKALLFNKFVGDMAAKHPKFNAHAADLKAKVKKQIARGEVIAEQQGSVKALAKELEAKCVLKNCIPPQPGSIGKSKAAKKSEQEPASPSVHHVSTLTVILKPSPERRPPQPRPRRRLERSSSETQTRESSQKRNINSIRSVLATEAYAPPKKIRRTRQERSGTDVQMFFQNEQMETLFYNWLSTENGKLFDITTVSNTQETIEIALEDTEEAQDSQDTGMNTMSSSMSEVTQRSAVERLLEEAIAKLEMEGNGKEGSHEEEKDVDTALVTPSNQTPKKVKRQAPPIPAPRPSLAQAQSTCITSSSSNSSCKQSEAEESESGLSTLPKITSDESQPDMPKEEQQANDFEFPKPQRPPRKKKMRRTLTWKKENSIVEATANVITSTDSDSDFKSKAVILTKKKPTNITMPEQSFVELDKSLIRQMNSPRKVKTAYTLTVMSSPSPNADSDQSPSQTPRQSVTQAPRDSFIDQGFETSSSNASPMRPASLSLGSSKPSGFSTPVKGRGNSNLAAQQQLFSPIINQDRAARRSSLAMQVIKEDHPLDLGDTSSSPNTPCSEREFFANAPTMEMNSTQNIEPPRKKSMFWVCAGDFTVSLEIFYNTPDRLRLLYEIFTQKGWESRDFAFGIDAHKFTREGAGTEVKSSLPERPPSVKGCSHYWFASGDLAVPFSGRHMKAEKIDRLFQFLAKELDDKSNLRFGVDHIEFSSMPEFCYNSQKFSIESNFSMLVGLQTGNSNGLEGRSKYAWPNNQHNATQTQIKTSDLDQTEFESDSISNNSGRLSFSPDMFSSYYETAPLDELFEKKIATPMSMPQMLQTLQQQQIKLKKVEDRIRSYSKPSNLADDSLEHCRNTPEYIQKLRSIIRAIDNIGKENGFRGCSMEQLESFMYFLSEYADVCLANCSDHMDKILDTLLARRAVAV